MPAVNDRKSIAWYVLRRSEHAKLRCANMYTFICIYIYAQLTMPGRVRILVVHAQTSDFALDLGVNLFFDTIQSYDGGL